jgi:hypothetical protein
MCFACVCSFNIYLIFVQNAESKKEEFQRYLEKSGVIDALTKGRFHILLHQIMNVLGL